MSVPRFRFLATLSAPDGSPLGQAAISPDWFPGIEAVRFQALRLDRPLPAGAAERIAPIWDSEAGRPYIQGVQVTLCDDEGGEIRSELPLT
ncbi:MAG TPA: hypothetical protein VKT32_03875, partial [Chthonomonadaceae bacterium]|nr:hypothetical protein [Chthonomonadaceae bacterium]